METITARSILTPATGYLPPFTHSLNPYVGCVMGCAYCYVAGSPLASQDARPWGTYFKPKVNAPEVLRRELARHPPHTLRILMSSATDPYQAAERRLGLTREILSVLAERPPALLLVQTRGPLVTRDLDRLQALGDCVRVSMTIETNRDEVRRAVSPHAPPLAARREALLTVRAAGIRTQVAVAPLLPHDPEPFAAWLAGCAEYVVVDTFVDGDGSRGRRTARSPIPALYAGTDWGDWRAVDPGPLQRALAAHFPPDRLLWSQPGFTHFARLAAEQTAARA
ncbi:MAG TPA: radical SAM protein, partial [Chloroflexia bacterium]|nr:radical SAM protein [Chloroflexia bacterium]